MNKKRFLASFLSVAMLCSPLQGSDAYSAKSDSNQGVNTAAKVAMGVGIGVAGLAVLLGVPLLYWGLSKDNSENKNQEDNSVSDNGGAVTDNSGNTTVNSDPKGTPKTNVSPVTLHKPVEPVVPPKKVPVGKPISDAQADYKKKNPTRDTFFEDYDWYKSGEHELGTRVGLFLSCHCKNDPKKPLGNSPKAWKDIRRGFLVKKTSGQGWVHSQDLGDDVPDRIFIQVGNKAEENISYRQLHSLLWSEISGHGGLTQFLREHHDDIKGDFLNELINIGYADAVNNAFPGRFQSQSDKSGPQVKPVDVSTGTQGGSTGSGVVSGPDVVTHEPVAPEAYYDDYEDTLTLDDIDPVKHPEICSFMRKADIGGGYMQKFRYMTQRNGQCATNMTGYGHGIAHIFAYVADEINNRLLKANPELRKRSVRIYKGEIPASSALTSEKAAGTFEKEDGANVVEKLEKLRAQGCKHLAIIDPANAHDPGGAPGGALTLEETICGESTLHTIIASSLCRPYYQQYDSSNYDPHNLLVARNVFFYGSRQLVKGYNRRQGVHPVLLNCANFIVSPESGDIFADVFVTAAPDGAQSGKNTVDETTFKKWVKQQALAAKELGIDGIVVTQVGVGAFRSFKPEWFNKGGLFEQTWKKYAPEIHVIVLDTPERYDATLEDATAYLDNLTQVIENQKQVPGTDVAGLEKVQETIAQAKKDVIRDADPLKKAVSKMVFAKSAEEEKLLSSGHRTANTLDVLLDSTVDVGGVRVDLSAIVKHVQPGKTTGKNVAACYYGAGAIKSFIEDAANAYKPLTWRNSNNYIWHQYSQKNPKNNGYRFSEPTNSLDLQGILKRFVEFNGKMYEAELKYAADGKSQYVSLLDGGKDVCHIAYANSDDSYYGQWAGNTGWSTIVCDTSTREWKIKSSAY
ncbi:MAG: hypothetical protein Q4D57_02210 [Clostridia bacterium]|nr:hypothetical protein [Clostridia bacterium]